MCKVVFKYIYRYEKVTDVVTDGFVKAFNHFEQFRYNGDDDVEELLIGWLKRIMINCSIDALRKSNMMPEIGGIPEDVWSVTDRSDNADQLLLYKELVMLIKKLPPQYRIVFNLYVLDGYNHSQIADILKIPIGTSRSNLARARTLLQQMITKMEESKECRI